VRNTADVTGGKPSDVSADHLLVTFYDIHQRNGELLLFCSIPDTTGPDVHSSCELYTAVIFLFLFLKQAAICSYSKKNSKDIIKQKL
jgi:hypothetical protein